MNCTEMRRLATLSSCQHFNDIGPFVSFCAGLLCQGRDFLWAHGSVVDANVVDQAGEESTWGESAAGAEIETGT